MKQLTPEQVSRLRPEARERYEKRLKAVKRNRKILATICVVLVVAAVAVALSMTVLFNISSVKVAKTGAIYTANEIIIASGLDIGDNMIRTDFNKASERIEKNLPYVLEATITKKLSGEVTISVKDTTAAILIEASDGYAVADINGKVLEILKEIPENSKFMVIKTNGTFSTVPGEKFDFDDGEEGELYKELVNQLKAVGIFESITAIDIRDTTSIKLEYQNRLRLLLGTPDQLELKLEGGVEVIKAENEKDPNTIAEINLTIPKKVFVNPLDTLEEPIADDDSESEDTSASTQENEENTSEETSSEADNSNDTQEKTEQNEQEDNTQTSTENNNED